MADRSVSVPVTWSDLEGQTFLDDLLNYAPTV